MQLFARLLPKICRKLRPLYHASLEALRVQAAVQRLFLRSGPLNVQSAVQFSASFDQNGHKLLWKAEQLVQRVGGHALAIFVDTKSNCNMYASSALQGLFGEMSAIAFLRDELVHKHHLGRPLYPVVSEASKYRRQSLLTQTPEPGTRHGSSVGRHWTLSHSRWQNASQAGPSACTYRVAKTCIP